MGRRSWAGWVLGTGAALAAYILGVRPWHLRWGATEIECHRTLPGDGAIPHPQLESTRAITIRVPPTVVWPWLMQLGQGRGGFYSYDWLENLIGLGIHSADQIRPELQTLKVGDIIRTDPNGGLTVAALEPARWLILRAKIDALTGRHFPLNAPLEGTGFDTSWAFILESPAPQTTRLVTRFRADYRADPRNYGFAYGVLEPAVFVMEQKMLRGIRQRAEGKSGENRTERKGLR